MSIPVLDASAWREYRMRPGNPGINVSTHLAKIADASGKELLCYVKLFPNPDSPALLCEALGWLLAGHSGINRADFAAIVMVDVAKLRASQALAPSFDRLLSCPAWCSQAIPGVAVGNATKLLDFAVSRKSFLRAQDSRKIAAFDQWSNLQDRNFGNVIRSAKGGYASIDHETMLYDTLWIPTGLTFDQRCIMEQAKKALDSKEFKRFQVDMANAAKGHAQAFVKAKADLEAAIDLVLENSTSAKGDIVASLDTRSQQGWLAKQLGVIA